MRSSRERGELAKRPQLSCLLYECPLDVPFRKLAAIDQWSNKPRTEASEPNKPRLPVLGILPLPCRRVRHLMGHIRYCISRGNSIRRTFVEEAVDVTTGRRAAGSRAMARCGAHDHVGWWSGSGSGLGSGALASGPGAWLVQAGGPGPAGPPSGQR